MGKETFTITTEKHDSCGEPSSKTIPIEHEMLVSAYIYAYEAYTNASGLGVIMRGHNLLGTDNVMSEKCWLAAKEVWNELAKELVAAGIFDLDNKWDFRTSWKIKED